jgi:anthranilate synthase/aminodeoxychorismate synthase-like glutamine amidotransferase
MGCETEVVRNDKITVEEVRELEPRAVLLSPGPCTPRETGICVELVQRLGSTVPMLGICLGHQVIASAFGGRIIRAPEPVHGRTSEIHHHRENIFSGLPNPLTATRYHSLIVEERSLPDELLITARTSDGIPMALQHRSLPVFGLQFHPESVLTAAGHLLLKNFLTTVGITTSQVPPSDFVSPPVDPEWISESPQGEPPLHW